MNREEWGKGYISDGCCKIYRGAQQDVQEFWWAL